MKSRVLSFGCLASPLARNQAQGVIDRLQELQPRLTCQLNVLPSPVPEARKQDEPFVTASREEIAYLERTVLDEQVRLVVLEASDMMLPLPEGLDILAVPDRATPFDAFLNRQGLIMDEMEAGGRVGVMSLRSRAQMQALWPDLVFTILRGGVERAMETHMRRSEIDGLVLPASVTEHLGIQGIVAEIFSPEFILPGPGQGILVVVGHAGDHEARELLAPLHSAATAAELTAEQAFCRRMISDQDLPVGALARVTDAAIAITGTTGRGSSRVTIDGTIGEAEAVGAALAGQILCSVESFADLLEADFPDGLPDLEDDVEDPDDAGGGESYDEDAGPDGDDDLDDFADFDEFDEFGDDEDGDGDDDDDRFGFLGEDGDDDYR